MLYTLLFTLIVASINLLQVFADDLSSCKWVLDQKCFAGGYGIVRKATCKRDNQEDEVYALKVPRQNAKESFEKEGNILEECENNQFIMKPIKYENETLFKCNKLNVNHENERCYFYDPENIIKFSEAENIPGAVKSESGYKIIKYELDDSSRCLLYNWASEGSLIDMKKKKPKGNIKKPKGNIDLVSLIKANYLKWFEEVSLAVKSLAKCGIIHRDIRLDNLFIDNKNDVYTMYVGDFGLAIKEKDLAKESGTPIPEHLLPTAPEIIYYQKKKDEGIRDLIQYTHKSDVFSVGAVFIYLFAVSQDHVFGNSSDKIAIIELDSFMQEMAQIPEHLDPRMHKIIPTLSLMIQEDPKYRAEIDAVLSIVNQFYIGHNSDMNEYCTYYRMNEKPCIASAASMSIPVLCKNTNFPDETVGLAFKVQRRNYTTTKKGQTTIVSFSNDTLEYEYKIISKCPAVGNYIKPISNVMSCEKATRTRGITYPPTCEIEPNTCTYLRFEWITEKKDNKKSIGIIDNIDSRKCIIYPGDIVSLPNVVVFFYKQNEKYKFINQTKIFEDNYLRWFIEMATAVLALNSCGVTHNDITPLNFLVKYNNISKKYNIYLSGYDLATYHGQPQQDYIREFIKVNNSITKPHEDSKVPTDMWMLGATYLILLHIPERDTKDNFGYLFNYRKYEKEDTKKRIISIIDSLIRADRRGHWYSAGADILKIIQKMVVTNDNNNVYANLAWEDEPFNNIQEVIYELKQLQIKYNKIT
eukprot:GHVR01105939.1.p1 GENE.GHVR01105939.1~~GHVR01105939.1.p1  ORF type:complete len:772 (-),score=83.57 GHVR01105939.1:144-2402(-)